MVWPILLLGAKMIISEQMQGYAEKSSWIRKMFEEGARLKALYGQEQVYDFSLGNPDIPPPHRVIEAIEDYAAEISHGYMANAGYAETREQVASHGSVIYDVRLDAGDIVMSCGAGGGLNVVLKSILNPGDEVITLAPYFVEYGFYIQNHGGRLVSVPCNKEFLPDTRAIKEAITEKTRAIIINSPNNPTGRVYSRETIEGIRDALMDKPDILVISDEPYRRLVYDGVEVPSILKAIPNSLVVTSASKDISLAGERIGYIALGPGIADKDALCNALILSTRILGFVNAPALMQKVLAACMDCSIDIAIYRRRRNILMQVLDEAGLDYAPPEGAFYIFVHAPLGDDLAFSNALVHENILVVPGTGFGYKGYVRFAYCLDERYIQAAADGIKRIAQRLKD